MKRERFYLLIIILLVVVNFCVLFFIMKKSGQVAERGNKLDERIERELALTAEQLGQFNEMKHRHRDQMRDLDESMKAPFEAYFSLLESNERSPKKDSLERLISDTYRRKLTITYDHFAELKSILTEDQKTNFKALVPHLLQVISPRKGGEGHPPPPPHFGE